MPAKPAKRAKGTKTATAAKPAKSGKPAKKAAGKTAAAIARGPAGSPALPTEPTAGVGAWESVEPAAEPVVQPPPPPVQVVSWGIAPPAGWMAAAGTAATVPIATRATRGQLKALVPLLAVSVGIAAVTLAAEVLVEDWGQPGSGLGLVALQGFLATASAGVTIALVVVFCLWLHRTLSNAGERHPLAGIRPGWAVGSFFVPFVHLVLPYFEVNRAWRADVSSDSRPVATWFILWAVSLLTGYVTAALAITIAFRTVFDGLGAGRPLDTSAIYDGMRPVQLVAGTISLMLQALAAYFLARMARQWTDHQEAAPVS